jgi:hypothetical protein
MFLATDVVKMRKVCKGHCVLLPDFEGSIDDAYKFYSDKWMKEYTDKDGNLYDSIKDKDVNYIDEFTVKDSTYFYIGLPGTYAYEGHNEEYDGYPGCLRDQFGFEILFHENKKPFVYLFE